MLNAPGLHLSPEHFITEVAQALPHSVSAERIRLLEHAKAWAEVSYPEGVPSALSTTFQELEDRWLSPKN